MAKFDDRRPRPPRSSSRAGAARSAIAVFVAAIAGAMALAAPAGATVTETDVTSPAGNPAYETYNPAADTTLTVTGTTDSTAPATDKVDLRCFYGDNGQSTRALGGVSLAPDGSFSASLHLSTLARTECALRAVPTGTLGYSALYAGPLLAVSEIDRSTVSGGPNAGAVYDYSVYAQQVGVGGTFASIGDCGLRSAQLFDTAYGTLQSVFDCGLGLGPANLDGHGDFRSEVQVDGVDAYPPASAAQLFARSGACPTACDGSIDNPGLTAVNLSVNQSPLTGDTTIVESEALLRCANQGHYPPTSANCASFAVTGVEASRTIVQTASGHVAMITDSFSSTDGSAHGVDLLYQSGQSAGGPAMLVGYRFRGDTGYSAHLPGDMPRPRRGPGSIYVTNLNALDGDPFTGQGAITYSTPPTQFLFLAGPASSSDFTMHYAGTVPAVGALNYVFAYSSALTTAQVTALAQPIEDKFGLPSVAITRPGNHAVLHTTPITVRGHAGDNIAVRSLRVNGRPIKLRAGGRWSTSLRLHTGKNVIKATVRDGAGNVATVSITVTYRPRPAGAHHTSHSHSPRRVGRSSPSQPAQKAGDSR